MTDFISTSKPFAWLLGRAERIIASRDHSKAELRRKLMMVIKREQLSAPSTAVPSQEVLGQVIDYCLERGWLDDARFAEHYVRSRCAKGYGPRRIAADLMQKGVDKKRIQQVLAAQETDWAALACQVARRKFGCPLPMEWQGKAKVQRFLLAKGFFIEDIQSVYRNFDN